MDLHLPNDFSARITGAFGERGRSWLARLPESVAYYRERWSLSGMQAHPAPSYGWIGFCRSPYGPAVLKLNVPNPEAVTEAAALAAFPASACCRCYEEDREHGALLLEALEPGTPLRATERFASRVDVAADLLARLHPADRHPGDDHPADADPGQHHSPDPGFPRYADQAARAFGRTSRLPELVAGGSRLLAWVEASREAAGAERLLHADLHHDNILRSGDGWKLIDPKGTMGPRALEAARFVINQYGDAPAQRREEEFRSMVQEFAVALAVEPAAVAVCAALDAAVSTCWSVEDNDSPARVAAANEQALVSYEWASGLADLSER